MMLITSIYQNHKNTQKVDVVKQYKNSVLSLVKIYYFAEVIKIKVI